MNREIRLKRLHFRAHHRGTKEADLLIGGFFDARGHDWNDDEITLFEELIEEQDVDIMAWAIGMEPVPERYAGSIMQAMHLLNYVPVAR
jgi:antitoxin CptB